MQTFLPFSDFVASARALDRQRLGKQRVECWQLLRVLLGLTKGWSHHPAALMWTGRTGALARYAVACCDEWRARGYKDTMRERFTPHVTDDAGPPWLGSPEFHRSHQSNLIRKLPEHYEPLFPGVPDNLPYIWPSRG